jgi:hypothetical protein
MNNGLRKLFTALLMWAGVRAAVKVDREPATADKPSYPIQEQQAENDIRAAIAGIDAEWSSVPPKEIQPTAAEKLIRRAGEIMRPVFMPQPRESSEEQSKQAFTELGPLLWEMYDEINRADPGSGDWAPELPTIYTRPSAG